MSFIRAGSFLVGSVLAVPLAVAELDLGYAPGSATGSALGAEELAVGTGDGGAVGFVGFVGSVGAVVVAVAVVLADVARWQVCNNNYKLTVTYYLSV